MAEEPPGIAELKQRLGQRLADLRKAARATQRDLARHTIVDRTYVSHAERGHQIPERSFWIAADDYLGAGGSLRTAYDELAMAQHDAKQTELDALRARHQRSAGAGSTVNHARHNTLAPRFLPDVVGRLSTAMLISTGQRTAGTGAAASSQLSSLPALAGRVTKAWQLRQRAHYTQLGQHLAELIPDMEHHATYGTYGKHTGADQLALTRLVVHTYNTASSLLKRLGNTSLALLAADRAVRAARAIDEPLLVAAAQYRVANVLLAGHELHEAHNVALQAADTIAPATKPSPLQLASWGGLILTAAVAAARRGDEPTAWELLGQARTAGTLLHREYADIHTIFGPTNVAIHAVQVAAELGNGQAAVARAQHVRPDQLPPSLQERRSQFLIDLASGQVLIGSDDAATVTLLNAECTAPQEVRFNPTTHHLVATMLGRERIGATPGLRGLAKRIDGQPS